MSLLLYSAKKQVLCLYIMILRFFLNIRKSLQINKIQPRFIISFFVADVIALALLIILLSYLARDGRRAN